MYPTLIEYLDHWATQSPNDVWLREPHGENLTEWTWSQVQAEVGAIAAWQESFLGGPEINVGLLSRNRAHWFMADLGTIAAGNVTIPMFITLPRDTAEYVMSFTEMKLLFVGETENWEAVKTVLPEGIILVTSAWCNTRRATPALGRLGGCARGAEFFV